MVLAFLGLCQRLLAIEGKYSDKSVTITISGFDMIVS